MERMTSKIWPGLSTRGIIAHSLMLLALLLIVSLSVPAKAQTYPFQSPGYSPTATLAPTTLTATGDYYFTASGVGSGTVRVSGLSGTLVATIQGSNDQLSVANGSASWTTLYYLDLSSPTTAAANSITANGFYGFNTGGFTRFRVHVTTLTGGSHTVTLGAAGTQSPGVVYIGNNGGGSLPTGAATSALQTSTMATNHTDLATINTTLGTPMQATGGTVQLVAGSAAIGTTGITAAGSDPCQNPSVPKSSAVINVGAAATTKIVDTSASTVVYACSFTATLAGTTPTVTFKTGTHGTNDCDTSTASLSGAFAPTTGSVISLGGGGTLMKSIAGGQLCATTVGTGSSFQGLLSYVQQ